MKVLARAARTLPLALILLLELAFGGCTPEKHPDTVRVYHCGNQIVKVDHILDKGVDHKAVYICDGNTVQWVMNADVASFEVVFVDPAFGNAIHFGTAPGETTTTPAYMAPTDLTVYKYNISIVDKNGVTHTFDPHLVGGGGL